MGEGSCGALSRTEPGQNFSIEILRRTKNHLICVEHEEKRVKVVKIYFLRFAHESFKILRKVIKILRGCTTV